VTEHDHEPLPGEPAAEPRRGGRIAALMPSDPAVVAVMRLAAAALLVTFLLWIIR
jgi:hypothetical protein